MMRCFDTEQTFGAHMIVVAVLNLEYTFAFSRFDCYVSVKVILKTAKIRKPYKNEQI